MRRIDLVVGDVYGKLTIIKEAYSPKKRKYLCRCSCGNEVKVQLDHLRRGHTTSCGKCGIEYKGESRKVSDWARLYNINVSTLRARLKTMSIREAIERGRGR